MLQEGMEIKIGGVRARHFHYEPVVGKKGIIVKIAKLYVQVDTPGHMFNNWHIQPEDCIPVNPLSNKEASMFLSKEW